MVFSTGLNLLWPYLMGVAIDSSMQRGDLLELARICGAMLVIFVLLSLLSWLQIYIMAGVAQETVAEIRHDLFGRLQLLPLRIFDQQRPRRADEPADQRRRKHQYRAFREHHPALFGRA